MNARQARFVQEYLVDRNGTGAAIRAGYSQRTAASIAHELLRKPEVADAVRQGEAQIAADVQLAREDVLQGLLEAVAMARVQGDPAAQIAGWREIGKMLGYYVPERTQIELRHHHHAIQAQYEVMTDAELMSIIAASAHCEPWRAPST